MEMSANKMAHAGKIAFQGEMGLPPLRSYGKAALTPSERTTARGPVFQETALPCKRIRAETRDF